MFVAPSAFMAQQLLRWGIPAARVQIVPNFTSIAPGASTELGEYGLYVGRLVSEKGLDILLRALAEAGDPPFKIVGTGPIDESLWALADQLRLRNTEFAGHLGRPAVDAAIKAARFVAMPSIWAENAPLAALEAMAAGRPLLVSAVGGMPELVADGAGLSCTAGDVQALAQGIRRLLDDAAYCRTLGSRALGYAERTLAPDLHRQRLEAVYERATMTGAATGRTAST
jgi:glycosyltransferase involved in cell wall biosynthesis